MKKFSFVFLPLVVFLPFVNGSENELVKTVITLTDDQVTEVLDENNEKPTKGLVEISRTAYRKFVDSFSSKKRAVRVILRTRKKEIKRKILEGLEQKLESNSTDSRYRKKYVELALKNAVKALEGAEVNEDLESILNGSNSKSEKVELVVNGIVNALVDEAEKGYEKFYEEVVEPAKKYVENKLKQNSGLTGLYDDLAGERLFCDVATLFPREIVDLNRMSKDYIDELASYSYHMALEQASFPRKFLAKIGKVVDVGINLGLDGLDFFTSVPGLVSMPFTGNKLSPKSVLTHGDHVSNFVLSESEWLETTLKGIMTSGAIACAIGLALKVGKDLAPPLISWASGIGTSAGLASVATLVGFAALSGAAGAGTFWALGKAGVINPYVLIGSSVFIAVLVFSIEMRLLKAKNDESYKEVINLLAKAGIFLGMGCLGVSPLAAAWFGLKVCNNYLGLPVWASLIVAIVSSTALTTGIFGCLFLLERKAKGAVKSQLSWSSWLKATFTDMPGIGDTPDRAAKRNKYLKITGLMIVIFGIVVTIHRHFFAVTSFGHNENENQSQNILV